MDTDAHREDSALRQKSCRPKPAFVGHDRMVAECSKRQASQWKGHATKDLQ